MGILRSTGGDPKAKRWGYRGQLVGIPRTSGGVSRSTGGGTPRTKGRGIEVKVKKSGGGCVPSPTPSTTV
jgi:hypothetical protein